MTTTTAALTADHIAIVAAAAGCDAEVHGDGTVWMEYSPHYGLRLGLRADQPEAFIFEEHGSREVGSVGEVGSTAGFAADIMAVAADLAAALVCVPRGNRERMGGTQGIAAALWTARRIAAYVDAGPTPLA